MRLRSIKEMNIDMRGAEINTGGSTDVDLLTGDAGFHKEALIISSHSLLLTAL